MTPVWQVAALAGLSGLLIAVAFRILMQRGHSPEHRERVRRLLINERGRLTDGMVTDVGPAQIHYAYSVAGVEYRTAQDVTHLPESLPPDLDRLIGPVTLKYLPRNPANSIVLCETWSGLRIRLKETISNDA
jgi:hypothetical protein